MIVNGYELDNEQEKIVLDKSKNLLVVAGAGSGKSLTIVGKVRYLVNELNIKEEEILCISFTNAASQSLKDKINMNVDVMTFHRLAISIMELNNVRFTICNTDYLEYITHEFFFGIIFEDSLFMKKVLSYFNIYFYINVESKYRKFLIKEKGKVLSLEKLIVKFIRLFKTNNHSIESFIRFNNCLNSKKEKKFLSIALNVYLIYLNELNSSESIDFDDMIINAKNLVINNGKIKNYKVVIIDEYQDTSYIRYLLIKSILDRTKAKFVAVGDDFQSIYRFSGCDLKLFVDFDNYYSNSNMLKIQSTYRNSKELISVAGEFIMRNAIQIKKSMNSNKSNYKPIKICYISLKSLLDKLNGNVMILGRTNNDIYKYIDSDFIIDKDKIIYKKMPNLNIRYLTIHRSKGLEEDNVIVLNVINSLTGIPNTIEDDNILRFVSLKGDYLYDEERRLFYVAITRTKNNVYLMTKKFHESIFIHEIIKYNSPSIEIIK